jgi:hypothetical protein
MSPGDTDQEGQPTASQNTVEIVDLPGGGFEVRMARHAAGYVEGRYFHEWPDGIRRLKAEGRHDEALALLDRLIQATEAHAAASGVGVAPWYYAQAAIIHRKRRDRAAEIEVLERFARQRHAPGVMPPRLLERLRKAKARFGVGQAPSPT